MNLLDTDFVGLTIDRLKDKDHLMFRLAENTNAVMIHKSVKVLLENKGFDILTFMQPEQ